MISFRATKSYSTTGLLVRIVLAIWFVVIFLLAANGEFFRPPEAPPFPFLIGATLPLIVFIAAYAGLRDFREMVLAADLRLLTAIQGWRAGGLGFLALYTYGLLPALFAWPAGLGDIAIGLTAPWIMLALIRRPSFATSRSFVVWNLLGILDLVVAVSLGALSGGFFFPGLVTVTTAPMSQLPMVLIPAYFVPLFIMLHLTALFQSREQSSSMSS